MQAPGSGSLRCPLLASTTASSRSTVASTRSAATTEGASGDAQFALHSNYTSENWFPEYDYDIGQPVGSEAALSNGAHRRQFSNGIVVVNPTSNQVSVDLCGGTYSGSGRSHVTSVQLGANGAAILTLDSGSSAGTCGTDSGDTGGSTGGDTGSGATTVRPGKGKVKRGKIVASGTVSTSGGQTALASSTEGGGSFKGSEIELEVQRHQGGGKTTDVGVGSDGSFVAKVRVCRAGSYEVHALDPATGERLTWPDTLRVNRRQLRC